MTGKKFLFCGHGGKLYRNRCHFFLSCWQLDLIFFYYLSSKSNNIAISIQSSEQLEHTVWVS